MRAFLTLPIMFASLLMAGCNTPPIPPGKPVDIPTALQQVTDNLCAFRKDLEARGQGRGVAIDSVTVELDLTVDGSRTPQIAVAPDVQFMPTVAYGHTITEAKGSRLTMTLKNVGAAGSSGGMDCASLKPAN
ncbi:hypothetical protein CupriaWKF_22975 [Cupriavidus sp. WKF15]|uniref:hypothetical protein n=1 Tax=Cupriavidus sp. WKF15 TaxID=3032282 RepID=UPI0023E1CA91|nr:hypothetical protein [Cupriavidus sp. WKF15]WER49969.1 hypothetical protein CupriaWKF_22975 [Cupriavidus sp. WKF15]